MHELAVCQALIDQVESIAMSHSAARVTVITLDIGPLSGIETNLLRHAYPLASHATVAQDAELIIMSIGVRVRCTRCGSVSDAAANRLVCNTCGEWRTEVVAGDELILASVELEKTGANRAVA